MNPPVFPSLDDIYCTFFGGGAGDKVSGSAKGASFKGGLTMTPPPSTALGPFGDGASEIIDFYFFHPNKENNYFIASVNAFSFSSDFTRRLGNQIISQTQILHLAYLIKSA